MNVPAVRAEFVSEVAFPLHSRLARFADTLYSQSACVKKAWIAWLAWYRIQPGVPAAANTVNIGTIYQSWIKGVVQDYQGTLETSITNLQTWWEKYAQLPPNAPAGMSKRDVPVPVRSLSSLMRKLRANDFVGDL